MTIIETTTAQSVDVPLGPGCGTLRVTLHDAPGGERALTLAVGYGGGDSGDVFTRPPWFGLPLQVPASALPALRDALDALAGTE